MPTAIAIFNGPGTSPGNGTCPPAAIDHLQIHNGTSPLMIFAEKLRINPQFPQRRRQSGKAKNCPEPEKIISETQLLSESST
jgi:hypothetical protein